MFEVRERLESFNPSNQNVLEIDSGVQGSRDHGSDLLPLEGRNMAV